MNKIVCLFAIICVVFFSCTNREIIENSSDNTFQNIESSNEEYYKEHFSTKLTKDYHTNLVMSRFPTFDSGDTLHIDDVLLYFRMFEMWDNDKADYVEELKPYIVEETMDIKVPKSIVIAMLLERFDIKIESTKSSFEARENSDILELSPQFLGSDYFPHTSKNGIVTVENELTTIKFDRLKMVGAERGEHGEILKPYFSKEVECEIVIKNYDKENYSYASYNINNT